MPSVKPRWSERRIWWTATVILVAWWTAALVFSAALLFWLGVVETWTGLAAMLIAGSILAYLADRVTNLLQRRLEQRRHGAGDSPKS